LYRNKVVFVQQKHILNIDNSKHIQRSKMNKINHIIYGIVFDSNKINKAKYSLFIDNNILYV